MFDIPLLNLFFFNWTKEHPLETHIPLFINLFISLIELELLLKTSNERTHVEI